MASFVLFPFLLPIQAIAQTPNPAPRIDQEMWADFQVAHPMNVRTDLLIEGGVRGGTNAGHLIYRRLGAGITLKWNKYLSFTPEYNFYSRDTTSLREATESRVSLAATVSVPVGRWAIQDRNLFERRFLTNLTTFRYRNRLMLERPVQIKRHSLKAFIWDEVFYDSQFHTWVRNRLALGAGKKVNRHLSVDLYYLRQNDGYTRPGDLNVLGISLVSKF